MFSIETNVTSDKRHINYAVYFELKINLSISLPLKYTYISPTYQIFWSDNILLRIAIKRQDRYECGLDGYSSFDACMCREGLR